MKQSVELSLADGSTARAIEIQNEADLPEALRAMGLVSTRPVLVVIGGASKLSHANLVLVRSLFEQVLAPLAESLHLFVVDGGTDAGVMQLIGQARAAIDATFPLIGVTPIELAAFPNNLEADGEAVALEPHHTHFLLVPGRQWGDESAWLAHAATLLAGDQPSVVVLINGGEITWKDALHNAQEDRPIIVVAGSGRTADILAKAMRGGDIQDERARALVGFTHLSVIDLEEDFETVTLFLKEILSQE